jgi:5-methylcytosine-specific restriction endonuclease McrA
MTFLQSLGRKPGTDRQGRSFSEQTKAYLFNQARPDPLRDPALYRRDVCGALMYWYAYGDTSRGDGWEVDHKHPVALGGADDLTNLQALNWRNNRGKADNVYWSCTVTF